MHASGTDWLNTDGRGKLPFLLPLHPTSTLDYLLVKTRLLAVHVHYPLCVFDHSYHPIISSL